MAGSFQLARFLNSSEGGNVRRSSSSADRLFSLGKDISADSAFKIKPEAARRGGLFTLTCAPRMSEGRNVVNGALLRLAATYQEPRFLRLNLATLRKPTRVSTLSPPASSVLPV